MRRCYRSADPAAHTIESMMRAPNTNGHEVKCVGFQPVKSCVSTRPIGWQGHHFVGHRLLLLADTFSGFAQLWRPLLARSMAVISSFLSS
jgi:hypothetical protein